MINRFAKILGLVVLSACVVPTLSAGQYETFDYHVQQMITQGALNDATGVETFREQLTNLPKIPAGDPTQAKPFYQQGLEHLGRNDLKSALAAFRQAFITDPADPEITSQLANTYLRQSRFKEAERLSVYALSLAPTQSTSWFILGQVYGQLGDAQRATGAFANAYRFASDQPQVAGQLQQLQSSTASDAIRTGARQALQAVQSTPTTTATTTKAVTATPTPSPPTPPTVGAVPSPAVPIPAPVPASLLPDPAPKGGSPATQSTIALSTAPTNTPAAPSGTTNPSNVPAAPTPAPARTETAPDTDNPAQRIYQRSIQLTCLIVTFRNGKTNELGSGLLVSEDGLVITNHHVVEKSDNLAVKCGGRESTATVHKYRKVPDLAVLQTSIKGQETFVFNKTYNQDLIGRDVFVIGNPYGLEGTFSTGIISGLREMEGVRYIQISAPVSPGNSGGPVILRDGTVIGIAAMGLKQGQNLNFAIAATEVIESVVFDATRMKSQPMTPPSTPPAATTPRLMAPSSKGSVIR